MKKQADVPRPLESDPYRLRERIGSLLEELCRVRAESAVHRDACLSINHETDALLCLFRAALGYKDRDPNIKALDILVLIRSQRDELMDARRLMGKLKAGSQEERKASRMEAFDAKLTANKLRQELAEWQSKYEWLRDGLAEYERYHFSVERLNNLIATRDAIEAKMGEPRGC